MKVCSRWTQDQSISKSLGLEILNVPSEWTSFVIDHEPPLDDMWAEIQL